MRIGLIDVDGHNYPNLPLMKLSAYHKRKGDTVEWYDPDGGMYDEVYMSKVFSFTKDYDKPIHAKKIKGGGTGYCIKTVDGKECYDGSKDTNLDYGIEHIYPDYSLYPEQTKDKAFGFMTRGCPRGCSFCHVEAKEGKRSVKVADLSEFWNGQKYIELLDPNVLACKDWKDVLQQLIDSGSYVEFNQGLDIRLMTEEKAEMLSKIKMKFVHFAWDRIEDKDIVQPRFLEFRKKCTIRQKDLQVYVLVGDRERKVLESDLYRIEWLKANGYAPYVMIYNKDDLPRGHELKKLQRYVNNRFIFWSCDGFENYLKQKR